jgi:ABC-type multidrug transport system fused ATPase/permease subunit
MAHSDASDQAPTDAMPIEAPETPWEQSGEVEVVAHKMLQTNQAEFLKAARGQRFAFATMKWLFLVIFLVALGAMIAAIRIATDIPEGGYDWARAGVVGAVAVMAVVLFALLMYMRPLAALERNSVVQAFLTIVVNSYWTRLLYVKEAADIDTHLEEATAYTVEHLAALLDRQLLGSSKYMDVVRRAQDEAGQDTTSYRSPV